MLSSNFYRPRMAKATGKEAQLLGDTENEEGISYFLPARFKTQYVAREGKATYGEYQITYNFSHGIRRNTFRTKTGGVGAYGRSGLSFRLLYDFLCRYFNGGEYFIDTYFEQVFPTRGVFEKLQSLNDDVVEEVKKENAEVYATLPKKKDGTPNMWYRISKLFMKIVKVWTKPALKTVAARLSREIKQDIKICLSTGKLPLRKQSVAESTMKERARFGVLDPKQFFFASGQLIDALRIYVNIQGDDHE